MSDRLMSFRYNGLTARVSSADPRDLVWLREFLAPAFEEVRTSDADCTVTLTIDTRRYMEFVRAGPQSDGGQLACFALDGSVVRLPLWTAGPSTRVLRDDPLRVFYILDPARTEVCVLSPRHNRKARMALMRVVREFAMTHSWKSGGLLVHGAALAVDGKAVVLAGPKKAGKTSLLTHLLRSRAATFVANDRTLVTLTGHGPAVRGMPTIVTLRPRMLKIFPGLRATLERRGYHHSLTLDEARGGESPPAPRPPDAGVGLTASQFCEVLGAGLSPQAGAAALVLPRVTGEPGSIRLEPLSADIAAVRLADSLVGGRRSGSTSSVFDVAPGRSPTDPTALERLCRDFTSRVRCFQCDLGRDAYQSASAESFLEGVLR